MHGTIYRAEDLESRVKDIINEFIFDVVNFKKLAEKATSKTGVIKEFEKLKKDESRISKEIEDLNVQLDTLTRKFLSPEKIIDDEQYVRVKNMLNEEKSGYSNRLKEIKFKLENLSRRMGESPKTQYERILPLVLSKGLNAQDYRKIMDGLEAVVTTKKVDVVGDLSTYSKDLIQQLYDDGYIVLKNFKDDLSWSPKRVYRNYGKTGRKVKIDWRVVVKLPWIELRGWLPDVVLETNRSNDSVLPNHKAIDLVARRSRDYSQEI